MKSKPGTMNLAIVGAMLAAAALLTGCSSSAPAQANDGAWAAEFADHAKKADNDFTREVLADGSISEQEFAETLDRFTTCLTSRGITISDYKFDGSFTTTFTEGLSNDQSNEATEECSRASGESLIGSLYSWIHRNPDKADENQIMAECLVKAGVVPAEYEAKDFATDVMADSYPFAEDEAGRAALQTCQMDPLGLQT